MIPRRSAQGETSDLSCGRIVDSINNPSFSCAKQTRIEHRRPGWIVRPSRAIPQAKDQSLSWPKSNTARQVASGDFMVMRPVIHTNLPLEFGSPSGSNYAASQSNSRNRLIRIPQGVRQSKGTREVSPLFGVGCSWYAPYFRREIIGSRCSK